MYLQSPVLVTSVGGQKGLSFLLSMLTFKQSNRLSTILKRSAVPNASEPNTLTRALDTVSLITYMSKITIDNR